MHVVLFVSVHFETLQSNIRELEAKTLFLNNNKQYAYAFFWCKTSEWVKVEKVTCNMTLDEKIIVDGGYF